MTTSYTNFRQNMMSLLKEVESTREPLIIKSKEGEFVLLSKHDFDSIDETARLMRNPVNAARILESIKAAKNPDNLITIPSEALKSEENFINWLESSNASD